MILPDPVLDPYDGPGTPGAAIMVLRRGSPPSVQVRGAARLDDGAPVSAWTAFRLASLTKQFTARAVALAAADGALSLDTPIGALVPGLPGWGARVRVGHLVAHTSGIPPYESLIPSGWSAQLTDRDVVDLLAGGPEPATPPGARFAYDNGGYALLAVALEEVTGSTFTDLLDSRIFRPLGMTRTVAHVEGRTRIEDRALGYREEEGGWADADQGPTTAVLGDGGVYSCLEDLARWDAALRRPGVQLDPAALAPFAAPVAPGVAYGFGWFMDTFDGRRRHRHEGWSTGFQNEIQRYPDEGLTVIVLTNRAEPPARALAELIARRS